MRLYWQPSDLTAWVESPKRFAIHDHWRIRYVAFSIVFSTDRHLKGSVSWCLDSRISLQLGTVTVWLGEDKGSVKQEAEAAGMSFVPAAKSESDRVSVVSSDRVYTLAFEGGKLVYADRNWVHEGSSNLPTVIDALGSLADQVAADCRIEHSPIYSPDTKTNRIFITCGQRGVLLTYGSIASEGKSYSINDV